MTEPTPEQLGPDILTNLYALADTNPGLKAAIMFAEAQAQAAYWKKVAQNGQSDTPKNQEPAD